MRRWIGLVVAAVLVVGGVFWLRPERDRLQVPIVRFVEAATGGSRRGAAPLRVPVGDDARPVLALQEQHGTFTYQTAALTIAEHSTLAFAIGVAALANQQGAIAFAVDACTDAGCEPLFNTRIELGSTAAASWSEQRIALPTYAGAPRMLRFRAIADPPGPRPLWADPTIFAPATHRSSGRNLVLLSIDTLRADHLESYGYHRDTAPFIDDTFARQGTIFEHCVAAATTTSPSHMTMFTSVPPSVHGVGQGLRVLPSWIATFPELLRRAGFTTGAITEDAWVGAGLGFGRGFASYVENKSPNLMEPLGQVDVTFGAAKTWLRRHRQERFFLFLHSYQVHFPYSPPAAYAQYFTDGSDDAANYDREIRFTDDTLRDLFTTIRELGLARDTVVLLTSDHGEEFSEHGCIWHGPNLYQEVTRVPLMLWGAGIPAGLRKAEPVGTIDVMPTLLTLAGLPIPAQAMGVSLTDALAGRPLPERALVSEAWADGLCHGPDGTALTFAHPGLAVRLGTRTLARYRRNGGVQYELYDLAADPSERRNLYAEDAASADPLRSVLDGHEQASRERSAVLRTARPADPETVVPSPLDDRQREKLRALGYTD